jgi:hypothetical protein
LSEQELEANILRFIEIAEKLPELYREKCFETLLNHYLGTTPNQSTRLTQVTDTELPKEQAKFTIPLDVRAFLTQYKVPEDTLHRLFLIEWPEIRPIFVLKKTKSATAQIRLALLRALENALHPEGRFEFSFEEVKKSCQTHGVYDASNFKNNFNNNAKFFRGLKAEKNVELSPDGKAELADTISAILE